MHFTQAVTIVISSELAPSMVDTLMLVSPDIQARIDAVFVCINKRTWHDGVLDQGLDGLLLDIGQQIDDHLTTALHLPRDRGSFLLYGASTTGTFESASTALSVLALHHRQLAFMTRNHI